MRKILMASNNVLGMDEAAKMAFIWAKNKTSRKDRAYALESWGMACQIAQSPNIPLGELFPSLTVNAVRIRLWRLRQALIKTACLHLNSFSAEQVKWFCAQLYQDKHMRTKLMHKPLRMARKA